MVEHEPTIAFELLEIKKSGFTLELLHQGLTSGVSYLVLPTPTTWYSLTPPTLAAVEPLIRG